MFLFWFQRYFEGRQICAFGCQKMGKVMKTCIVAERPLEGVKSSSGAGIVNLWSWAHMCAQGWVLVGSGVMGKVENSAPRVIHSPYLRTQSSLLIEFWAHESSSIFLAGSRVHKSNLRCLDPKAVADPWSRASRSKLMWTQLPIWEKKYEGYPNSR